MPRAGYDCSLAAPGSFASRQGRQMFPCGGGNTPRASQMTTFPDAGAPMQYHQPMGSSASQMYAQPHAVGMSNGSINYSFAGQGAPHAAYMPQQQHAGAYMGGPGYAPAQPQIQTFTHYGYAPSTAQVTSAGAVANQGMMYAATAPPQQQQQQQQQQYPSAYGYAPAQVSYYRQ